MDDWLFIWHNIIIIFSFYLHACHFRPIFFQIEEKIDNCFHWYDWELESSQKSFQIEAQIGALLFLILFEKISYFILSFSFQFKKLNKWMALRASLSINHQIYEPINNLSPSGFYKIAKNIDLIEIIWPFGQNLKLRFYSINSKD